MKKLLHIITLSLASLSISYAEMNCYVFTDKDERAECERMNIRESMSLSQATKKKEKRWFLGIEGGVDSPIISELAIFIPKILETDSSIGYIAGANFGWQKYGKGRVGTRFTIGMQYMWGNYVKKDTQAKKSLESFMPYFASDLMIDFIKRERKHFGMLLGLEGKFSFSHLEDSDLSFLERDGGALVPYLRAGFYLNLGNHILDLRIGAPFLFFLFTAPNTIVPKFTPTLGYKYLF